MIHRSYVFVNRKTKISEKIFTADVRTAGGAKLRKKSRGHGRKFTCVRKKSGKIKVRVKNIVFFRKICVMPIDK